ncbi:MAG: thioredoxin domain-containing protein [Patescibacteria group bacterium]|nr:DsbA family protein [Patescibacteria group bacterium]MDE1940803.1 thioredoxin domain-containing protein [Patescibacteria group bacterium]MDE1966753.1 thioredoxin domain-containing protein [Patescibacteria group bacterium]
MNKRRILFWSGFVIVLGLIVWGLVASMNQPSAGLSLAEPAPVTAKDHVIGPADAPVTLIEYSDFQCPACEAYYPIVTQVFQESSSTMRLVYRHFPLPQHPNAVPAAVASEAANVQGKFWGMYNMLFENHADWTELSDPTPVFVGYAEKLGLDVAQFKADLASSTIRGIVTADEDEGIHIGIDHTPTFFLNGKELQPQQIQDYASFKAAVDAAASSSPR